jgi:hypothetical protein
MSPPIGFSTGSLLPGDTRQSLRMVRDLGATAIELSALRAREIPELLQTVESNPWDGFRYVSVHAPSRYPGLSEAEIVRQLRPVIERGWSLTIHPDAIEDWHVWAGLGPLACVENMDSRKSGGRTVRELEEVFRRLPAATFCLDVAHARNLDPSLALLRDLIESFGPRMRQIHLSEVDGHCVHHAMSPVAVSEYEKITSLIGLQIPILLETPVDADQAKHQLDLARELFGKFV